MELPLLNEAFSFFRNNTPAAVAAAFLLVLFIYKKPKLFFTMVFLIALLLGIYYVIDFVSDTGTTHKQSLKGKQVMPVE